MANDTLILILLEIITIIGLARIMGLVFHRLKQPPVIGEIIAGIMLGPSLLGLISPAGMQTLFPTSTQPFLYLLSQIGLIFYMFLVGLELNPKFLKNKLKIAIFISNVSIFLPFIMGVILSFFLLYQLNQQSGVSFLAFTLFVGVAMSITAFPVLARILTDNNLAKTPLGTLALTCASIDDISAWCLLAIAVAVTRTNSMAGAIPTLISIILYAAVMVTLGRRIFGRFLSPYRQAETLSTWVLTFIYVVVILSAILTEWMGIDVIFGGFIIGAIMPKDNQLNEILTSRTKDFVEVFLLPIFFAYSGLNTQLSLLNNPYILGAGVLIILGAVIGKYSGAYYTSRFLGVNKPEAQALGLLMNTRGLTELIVLNIGLKLKVISPTIFSLFVIMALVTTIMTSPLLDKVYPRALMTDAS